MWPVTNRRKMAPCNFYLDQCSNVIFWCRKHWMLLQNICAPLRNFSPNFNEVFAQVIELGYFFVAANQSTVWVKEKFPLNSPDISRFSHKRLRIFNRFLSRLLHLPIYARLQICIKLSLTLTKLCHIKLDYPVHIICAKCPKRAKTRALKRLRKSLINLLIVVCGK